MPQQARSRGTQVEHKLTPNEVKIVREIKTLTKLRGYGNINIVIRDGRITAISVTRDIRPSAQQEDNLAEGNDETG